jgi:hypothetical protein
MRYCFLDEAGDIRLFTGSRFLVVAGVVTDRPRLLELQVKRAHQSLGGEAEADELKATRSEPSVTERFLRGLTDVEVVAVAVDKDVVLRPPSDREDIYREVATRAVYLCAQRWPRLEVHLDKRYTKQGLRDVLERVIREGIATVPHEVMIIRQDDSRVRKELQAADFIAWAFYQKYERGNERYWAIIKEKVVAEEVIQHHLW